MEIKKMDEDNKMDQVKEKKRKRRRTEEEQSRKGWLTFEMG